VETETAPPDREVQIEPPAVPAPKPAPKPAKKPAPRIAAPTKPSVEIVPSASALVAAEYRDVPGWAADDHVSALKAFLVGCPALEKREAWRGLCQAARKVAVNSPAAAKQFFETQFRPYRVLNPDGTDEGLITGYYEPLLHASRRQNARYRYPIHALPDDLLAVDLGTVYPELKGLRLRGRLDGRRIVPYYTRGEIERREVALNAKVLYWADDPVELFFLQVQGSGQLILDTGERVRIGYADQNGFPYRSIGRHLIDQGELTLEQASMQGIKAWAQKNPEKLADVLHHNASYVFFRDIPNNVSGPIGALGVPVSATRSLAIDPRFIPLGAPVYLSTTWPNTKRPLQRLMIGQDTGSAIRGAVRGDFFWGSGEQAGLQAGRMSQRGKFWVLLPIGLTPKAVDVR
jgi:membrane-bound lytic murein transglycosylase A